MRSKSWVRLLTPALAGLLVIQPAIADCQHELAPITAVPEAIEIGALAAPLATNFKRRSSASIQFVQDYHAFAEILSLSPPELKKLADELDWMAAHQRFGALRHARHHFNERLNRTLARLHR